MDDPRYPHRDFVQAGECGKQPLKDLEEWVRGSTFHTYGVRAIDRGETIEESLRLMHKYPGMLHFEGEAHEIRGMDWSVRFQQAGDSDSWGFSRPHMTPEDAAYSALTLIEEHDREVWEENLVIGVA